jgi:hypothetical protein
MQTTPLVHESQNQYEGFGRRTFLARVMGGGVGAAFMTNEGAMAHIETDAECKPSAADSLILYLDLLTEIQFQAVKDQYTKVVILLKSCQQVFDEVYEEVKILEAELNKSKLKSQARQIRELAETGRASARLMRDYLGISGSVEYASLNTLSIVSEQVAHTAQNLLPEGEVMLSAAGVSALNKIIGLVNEYKKQQSKATTSQVDHREALNDIHRKIVRIRELLFSASYAIAGADEPGVNAARAGNLKSQANDSINQAIKLLNELPQAKPEQADAAQPRDTFVTLLHGTQKWISNPAAAEISYARGSDQAIFVQVGSYTRFTGLNERRQRVRSALNIHCGPSSILRTLYCLTLVIPIWVLFPSPTDRLPLIEDVLDLFPCPSGGSKTDLASTLAQIQF